MLANHAGIAAAPAGFDPRVAADDPAELRQCLHEYRDAFLASFLVRNASERRNASYALALLRARRERPRGCAAEQRDERAPPHAEHRGPSNRLAQSVGRFTARSACFRAEAKSLGRPELF